MGIIDEEKTTVRAAKREEKSRERARARQRARATEEWLWEVLHESGLHHAVSEWVNSLEEAHDALYRSGTDDKCQDQIIFELSNADSEIKARVIEALDPSHIGILKLHEILALLEPLSCKGLKDTD